MPAITHCSINTRTSSLEQPIGSASGFRRSFLLEVPLPWTKKALESTQISLEIKQALADYRQHLGEVTATLLVPDSEYAVEGARLIDIQVVDGALIKRDLIAPNGDIAAVLHAIAHGDSLPESTQVDDAPWRDLIVCTQGSRDACCGTFGVPIYTWLRDAAMNQPHTRVWRSSHLGGHRFAPTLVDFPTGRSWGFVDDSAARSILMQDRQPAELREHYRGWIGHQDAELQLLEGEVLAEMGWDWLTYAQRGEILARDEQGRGICVQIVGTHPDGDAIAWRCDIEWGEEFSTIASCNAAPVTYVHKRAVNIEQLALEATGGYGRQTQ